jgi:hypothetical protein
MLAMIAKAMRLVGRTEGFPFANGNDAPATVVGCTLILDGPAANSNRVAIAPLACRLQAISALRRAPGFCYHPRPYQFSYPCAHAARLMDEAKR